ncbi:molybdate ABC transporter substrate-binding protein [Kocuria sediminis]|uniref:Molybdate ABC transporter substrate-binding protein n=1 Tax=Kocuria sediminis TaxID=1038857 RepID=A0A6N8GJH7_9MICC|nr:molybdate ABC transporter substrate-binding protein [Kocuria sediminis]MUN63286.1 molybdate ABC transporter substrate-binding protein [Kocuria sediminis]
MPLHRSRTPARARGRARRAAAAGALLAAVVLAGCGTSSAGERVDVYAASSLTGAFTDLAAAFEEQHPGVDVALNFAGSADLAVQIAEGAPADVFVAADEPTMQRVLASGRAVGEPVELASNRLTIAVAEGNPHGVRSPADLRRTDLATVVCAEQVPCGRAARALEERAGVALRPVSEENSVTDVLGKVRSGQADAGLVYVTDVAAHEGELDGVPLPGAAASANTYSVVGLDGAAQDRAAEFTAFVTGPAGREQLRQDGFDVPG